MPTTKIRAYSTPKNICAGAEFIRSGGVSASCETFAAIMMLLFVFCVSSSIVVVVGRTVVTAADIKEKLLVLSPIIIVVALPKRAILPLCPVDDNGVVVVAALAVEWNILTNARAAVNKCMCFTAFVIDVAFRQFIVLPRGTMAHVSAFVAVKMDDVLLCILRGLVVIGQQRGGPVIRIIN